MLRKSLLLVFALLIMTLPAIASDYRLLAEDLKPAEGTIIMPIGDEFLIDLDSSSNLKVGDIISLVLPGEAIIHPVSKEVLGNLDVIRGFLTITRIKSGYSYAKLLSEDTTPKRGDKVVRFEQTPARISDAVGDTVAANAIKSSLPQLHWLAAGSADRALLNFQLEAGILSIIGPEETPLYQYAIQEQGLAQIQAVAPDESSSKITFFTDDAETSTGFLNAALQSVIGSVSASNAPTEKAGTTSNTNKLNSDWSSQAIPGKAIGVAVADYDGDGLTEIAIALHNQIIISRLAKDSYQQLATLEPPSNVKLLGLDAIDLDRNGLAEIYVTAAAGEIMTSFSIRYENGSYNQHTAKTRWYLRSINIPGEGPVLIGQNRGLGDNAFLGLPFKVTLAGDELVAGEEIELPGGNLYAATPLAGINNDSGYAHLNRNDNLIISDIQGIRLWQSEGVFGGSLTLLETNLTGDGPADILNFMPAKLSTTTDGTLLAPQNYGPRLLSYWRSFDNSRLVAMKWNGTEMQEYWSSGTIAGYLADFVVADIDNDQADEAVLLIQTESGLIKKQAATMIRSLKLSQ